MKPAGPVVKACPSSVDGKDSVPGGEAKIPRALGKKKKKSKTWNRSNIVTNSVSSVQFSCSVLPDSL